MKKAKSILLVILCIACVLSTVILFGCKQKTVETHVHNYTIWQYDNEGHWKECEANDGATSEKEAHNYTIWQYDNEGHWKKCECGATSEKEEHVFVDGKCECGASEPKFYSTASGQVKLYKLGKEVTDYTGVNVEIDDDDVVVNYNQTTGEFTISNAEVGKEYTLTITKEYYETYSTIIQVEKDTNTVIGGSNGIVLNYKMFTNIINMWNDDYIAQGLSLNIDEGGIPYISSTRDSFALKSNEGFDDVAMTLYVKKSNNQPKDEGGAGCQGIVFMFGNKYVQLKIKRSGAIETSHDYLWSNSYSEAYQTYMPGSNTWWLYDKDGKTIYQDNMLTEEELAKYEEGTFSLTLVRQGAKIYIYVDGKFTGNVLYIADELANQKTNIGIYGYELVDSKNNPGEVAVFKFNYETDIDKYIPEVTVNLDVDSTGGTATLDKESYTFGDKIILTVEPDANYILGSVYVNGKDVTAKIVDNKIVDNVYSFYAYYLDNVDIRIKFVEYKEVDATITLTSDSAAEGATLTFRQGDLTKTGVVSEGQVVVEDMMTGEWDVYTTFNNITVNLGKIIVQEDGSAILDLTNAFKSNSKAVVTADFATGTFTYKPNDTKNANYQWLQIDQLPGSGFVMTKLSLDGENKAKYASTEGPQCEACIAISFKIGGKTYYMDLWTKGNEIISPAFATDGGNRHWIEDFRTETDEYNAFMTGDGVYFGFGYDAETGMLSCYMGTSPDNVRKVLNTTWSSDFYADPDESITAIGLGNWLCWGSSDVTITVNNLTYGSTLEAALQID
ncbi:MAG TPA: hypothetical protein VIL26_02205 [Clostridia bacterium]